MFRLPGFDPKPVTCVNVAAAAGVADINPAAVNPPAMSSMPLAAAAHRRNVILQRFGPRFRSTVDSDPHGSGCSISGMPMLASTVRAVEWPGNVFEIQR
jgi:hypothetical protein